MTKKITVDRGHGGKDVGAVGYVTERTVAVKVGDYMVAHLKENYDVLIQETLGTDSLNTRCSKANSWDADLFVSIHFNAGGGDGFEALVYGVTRKKLGEVFAKHAKAAGQNLRSSSVAHGVKYRPDLAVLRLTTMPAVLNEIAFVDNKKDIKDWDENAELKKMGIAIAEAAAEWLDLPAKEEKYKALQDMNFRKTASLNGEQLGVIKKGTVLAGTVDKNGWLKTTYNGKTGFVRQKGQQVYCQKV